MVFEGVLFYLHRNTKVDTQDEILWISYSPVRHGCGGTTGRPLAINIVAINIAFITEYLYSIYLLDLICHNKVKE